MNVHLTILFNYFEHIQVCHSCCQACAKSSCFIVLLYIYLRFTYVYYIQKQQILYIITNSYNTYVGNILLFLGQAISMTGICLNHKIRRSGGWSPMSVKSDAVPTKVCTQPLNIKKTCLFFFHLSVIQ